MALMLPFHTKIPNLGLSGFWDFEAMKVPIMGPKIKPNILIYIGNHGFGHL
jgi:hypothetical protein